MRKVLVAFVVLILLAVAGLAFVLPGLVSSEAVQGRIADAAREATGREFRYADLGFGFFPPRLRLSEPSLSGEAASDPPFMEAREVSLQLALWPLLARSVVLENLVVEEATLRLVRDADGIRLPEPPAEEAPADPAPSEGGPSSGKEEDSGVSLAVEEVALRGSRIVLEDRTVAPAATWDIEDLDATARLSLTGPAEIDVDARVEGGGFALDGTADLEASTADLEAKLDGIGLAALAPYLDDGRSVAGALSGTVGVRGAFATPEIAADLDVAESVVRIGDVDLRGPLALRANLRGGDALSGTFDVDATAAELDAFEGAYRKPAGRSANVKGRLVPREDGGLTVDDVELKIHNVDARGKVDVDGERVRASLNAEPFDLAGWDELVPALAEYGLRGTVRPEALAFTTEPLSFHGKIGLDGVEAVLPDGPPVVVRGAVEGKGDAAELVDVVLETGGEALRISGRVDGLSKERMRYKVRLGADGAETNTLLSAFAGVSDQVFGPLQFATDLSGVTGDEKLEDLTGRVAFEVTPGRWKDVSLLEQTVLRLGDVGEAALLVATLKKPERAKKMERYYGDEFEALAGTFDVAQGWARTEDLRLVYDGYRVDLAGGLRLFDQLLDFTGKLTLKPEVDQNLADASGEPEPGESRERVIELARVKGTLAEPDVEISSAEARSLAGSYARSKVRRKYGEKLDEKLGEGASEQVGELIEGLFGGKR